MKKLRLYLAALITTMCAFGGVLAAVPAHASLFDPAKEQACNAVNQANTGGCTTDNDKSSQVDKTLQAILNILSFVVGVVAVIMLIIGGIRFVTSQGEGSSTALARNTIIYALVGIVIALLAQVIVKFVIHRSTATPVSTAPAAETVKGGAH